LAIAHEIVVDEQVSWIVLLDHLEHGSGNRAWVAACGGAYGIALLNVLNSFSDVHNDEALSLDILKHDEVVPSQVSASGIRPGHLLEALLILGNGLCKRKSASRFFGGVVVFLDALKLEVFVPVSNLGFDGVFGASLQLLGSVLHF
jgi:hypothetical protein